jgi:hypothetical protein
VNPQYLIKAGVRRCVAAREAGLKDIPAIVIELGKPDVFVRIPLNQLYSSKAEILRDYRYIRYTEYPTLVLKTEPPPIHVEPLRRRAQKTSTPLSQVILK